jgi:hypothetical protein
MACCALGTCDDPDCRLCRVIAKLPQPRMLQAADRGNYSEPAAVAKRPSRDPSKIKRNRKPIRP